MLQRHKINNTPMHLIEQACNYANTIVVRDFTPVTEEWVRSGMQELYQFLETLTETNMTPENIQPACYEIGKKHHTDLKLWFQKLYNALFGTTNGPRLGTFFAYAGKEMSLNLINNALHRA
jgi:lysyl-tRNA synthetase class I